MSILIFLLIFLISSSYEAYEKLPKYDSVEVIPDTKVYIDIASYNIGELISLEIGLDFIHGSSFDKEAYSHKIGQVAASTYYDPDSWKNLPNVKNSNVTCDNIDYCIFKWEEIKSAGNNFIYITTPVPFKHYYSDYRKK